MNTQTTLITGSSSGIGLHLAREFAAHGYPVILVAPVAAELEAIAAEIASEYNVHAEIVPKDLELPSAAREIFDHLHGKGIAVDILINNAGHGFWGKSWEIPLEQKSFHRSSQHRGRATVDGLLPASEAGGAHLEHRLHRCL